MNVIPPKTVERVELLYHLDVRFANEIKLNIEN